MVQSPHEFPPSAPVAYPLFYRTYSRMVDGQRETWEQMCHRTISGLKELGDLTEDEAQLMARMQREVIALPSGRWLWVGGTDWVNKPENFPGAFNCLAGDTVVTTKEYGACKISELAGNRVHVVNGNRQWVIVDFESFGEQSIYEITLRRGVASGAVKTIRATSDHSWVLVDGQRRTTKDLAVGSYLKYQTAPRPTIDEDKHILGIQHGIVYGDGSAQAPKNDKETNGFRVRLCKEKNELLKFFADCGRSYPESCNGDPIVYLKRHPFKDFVENGNLKELPCTDDESYLLGFIRGLIATDGNVSRQSSPVVSVCGQLETLLWVESVVPRLGIENGTMRCLYEAGTKSNLGVRKTSTYASLLYAGSLTPDDFLRTKHREIFGSGLSTPSDWRVLDVQELHETEEVFCCEEPDTHAFLLTGGILTGNCTSTNVVDWRAFGLMMDLAMQGCGTGAVLEDKYISQIPAIRNQLNVTIDGELGTKPPELRQDDTEVIVAGNRVVIRVGDSRQGWADSYQFLLELSTDPLFDGPVDVSVDLSSVRPSGEPLKGFGGMANPIKLPALYGRCAAILNRAVGRKLTAVECCLLIDEAAGCVVAGNIRRCLPEDAMVHTDHGLVPIKDIQVGDMVQTPLGFRRVVNKFDQGVQDVYQVPCNHPVLPRATLKHRMAVVARDKESGYGWKPVWDLEPGDLLLYTTFEAYDFSQGIGLNSSICVTGMPTLCESTQTYDIEVEEAHCFYCDGYLTHNSAGIRQFDSFDELAAIAKDNLWQQGEDGEWRIDPERDALRMANHTRVFHQKPSLDECIAAVTKQFWSGEGAIQWAGEAIARSNADLLDTPEKKKEFLEWYCNSKGEEYLGALMDDSPVFSDELEHRLQRYSLNPCAEIISSDFFCNLAEVHLNQINPFDFSVQKEAFTSAALSVAVLLKRQFMEPRYRKARDFDPIVGVSFTGLFDFFVNAFGVDWLRWWEAGRPEDWASPDSVDNFHRVIDQLPLEWNIQGGEHFYSKVEQAYLSHWKAIVHEVVWDYCDRHHLKRPNRCTTVQPAGSKSLLTGASPGWHPPKAQRFIRRVTFRKGDPVALACIDYGYTVVPSQSDKDEQGNLLNDPFDPRCTEWLVEIPVEVPWANLPGADAIHIERFSVAAQFDFYMQVQKHYTTHNTSATLELREGEIKTLAALIYAAIQDDEGYISAAILARFDDLQTFPRLPFEPIDKATYESLSEGVLQRRVNECFHEALARYDAGDSVEAGPAGCDSDKCMMPERKP